MTNSFNNKNIDKSEWIQWIEDVISKRYINYHVYDEFQNIQHTGSGAFGNVYRANWKSSNTVVALKSFRSDGCIMKEIVNEVIKKINNIILKLIFLTNLQIFIYFLFYLFFLVTIIKSCSFSRK